MKSGRAYDQTLRAQKALESELRVLDSAERLFRTGPFDRVTLAAIAIGAGVTVPTVQRRFGTKDDVFAAVAARVRERVAGQRGAPPVGDVRAAIAQLVAHYEAEGALVWHLLRQEDDVPLLRPALAEARQIHRTWVEQAFAPALARVAAGAKREARTDALVAVTDLFVWKLLRLDLQRSRAAVELVMMETVRAVLGET